MYIISVHVHVKKQEEMRGERMEEYRKVHGH